MRGTVTAVNRALYRPLLIAGVEKRLFVANCLLSFPLVASTHFKMPACFLGLLFFALMHFVFKAISKHDPAIATLFKRSTRYAKKTYFPAVSHPLMTDVWPIKTITRPW